MEQYQTPLMKEHLKLTGAIVEYGLSSQQIREFSIALALGIQHEAVGSLKWEFQTRLLNVAVRIGILTSKPNQFDGTLDSIFDMVLGEFSR